MAVWTIIVMLIFAVLIGVFIFLTYRTEEDNKKRQNSNILYPFSGYLANPSPPWTPSISPNNKGVGAEPEDGLSLLGMGGGDTATTPQIQCPSGYKINIVGAFLDIVDPYGECSNKPNNTLLSTCGVVNDLSSAATCSNDNDCGDGFKCDTQLAKCVPKPCSTNSDCGSNPCEGSTYSDPTGTPCMQCIPGNVNGTTGSYCALMPTCLNTQISPTTPSTALNTFCSPSMSNDNFKCRPRDASAYLAAYCDGKNVCLGSGDIWKPNTPVNNPFGPLPCNISATKNNSNYASLPVIAGWGGGAPNKSASGDIIPSNFNQGYYVHGIYTCVPEDENVVTS